MLALSVTKNFGCYDGIGGRLGKVFQKKCCFSFDKKKEQESIQLREKGRALLSTDGRPALERRTIALKN